jgi:hypothetical protein
MNVRTFAVVLCLILIIPPGFYLLFDRRPATNTMMTVEPAVIQPGEDAKVISVVDVLRMHCRGQVYPEVEIMGFPIINLPMQHVAIHDKPGLYGPYRYVFRVPDDAPRGATGIFRRRTDRWCNPIQEALWPMHEVHEAKFQISP